jgi:flagellar assembly protein FliH
MTTVIRSARVAPEVKTVPVSAPATDPRKPQIQQPAQSLNPPSAPHSLSALAPTSISGSGQKMSVPAQSPPPTPVVPTYEEYKQRFAAELAQLRQQAIDAGSEQGLQQGRATAQAEFQQQINALRSLIESTGNAHARYVEDVADEAGEIVFAAICKMLGDGFASREASVAAVRVAVGRAKERGRLLVRVSPRDFELLSARRRELVDVAVAGEVELVADEKVKLGGCLLEGPSGTLDARLETQLQRLREALLQARASWGQQP